MSEGNSRSVMGFSELVTRWVGGVGLSAGGIAVGAACLALLAGDAPLSAAAAPLRGGVEQPATTKAGATTGTTTAAQERRFVRDLAQMGAGGLDPDSMGTASRELYGEFAPVLEILARQISQMRSAHAVYVKAVEEANILAAVQTESLDSVEEIEASLRRVHEARAAHAAMVASFREVQQRTHEELHAVEMAAPMKAAFLREFDKSYDRANQGRQLIFEYEQEVYDEITARLGLVLARQGEYKIEADTVVFDADADFAEYNASITRCMTLAERQQEVAELVRGYTAAVARSPVARRRAERAMDRLTPTTDDVPALVFSAEEITLGGERIEMPWPLEEARRVLGEPSSAEVVDGVTVTVWASHGAAAYSVEGATTAVAVRFTTDGETADEPIFRGRVTLLGHQVRPHDTPWSLNRRLKEQRFEPEDDEWLEWAMYFDRYAVSMTMREDGLSGDVTLHTVDLGAAPAGAAGPENTDAGG